MEFVFALHYKSVKNKGFVMKKVNVTQIQDSFNDFLNCIDQEQIVIEKEGKAIATLINYEEWKRLKQVEIELMNEDNEIFYTVEEVVAEYNQIHGTEFTLENLKNG
jgi:PHD/YefM family antitoxin component YafN of YafNO toxin-antitoxin module